MIVRLQLRTRQYSKTLLRARRGMATMHAMAAKPEKPEGSLRERIGNSFASLAGEKETLLPERYLELKQSIIGDEHNQQRLIEAWARLTKRLAAVADEIEAKQQDTIPEVSYDELVSGKANLGRIKSCGTVVVRGVFSEDQATKWLQDVREYIKLNPQVKGFPEDDKQVYEIYWSKAQLEARSHPRFMKTQAALLSLFSKSPVAEISLATPVCYVDRLRIRNPGDGKFALGPHMDGGSIERWEDVPYRRVYSKIFEGRWEDFSAWEADHRALATYDLYPGPGSSGLFRTLQGWTSLSHTGPNEGTLRVFPFMKEMSAYVMMRPLFKPANADLKGQEYLAPSNWELDFETTNFPGSPLHRNQEMNDTTHPHLQLLRTMVSVPKVRPGDQVYWHSDVIHAVESHHHGKGPAAVFYIPAIALTPATAAYIRDQRATFHSGRPSPDFPGGVGESKFKERGTQKDILTEEGLWGMGLAPFPLTGELTPGEKAVRAKSNQIWGFA